jgi:hypothetical protein
VFRCAVYYASHTAHDPRMLKWWAWKYAHVSPPYRKRSPRPRG